MSSELKELLAQARYSGNKSQEYMAEKLDVSINTVKRWEKGETVPSLDHVILWFRSAGVNPIHSLLRYAHPEMFNGDSVNVEEVDKILDTLKNDLPVEDKLAVIYLFCGQHGSSPSSIIQLMLAHLHNPIEDRIPIAAGIIASYEINKRNNRLICADYPLPNIEVLKRSITNAIDATVNENIGYLGMK